MLLHTRSFVRYFRNDTNDFQKPTPLDSSFFVSQRSAMSLMLFVTLTLIWALPVKAEVLTLSCDGTMKAEEEQAKPQAITKMRLIVNFDAGVVTGFTGITGRIDEVNANQVAFKGTTAHPSGTEWSVHGTVDRITGSVGAVVTWFNPKTDNLLIRMNYDLICKPT
jgi:hypothetical protein